MQARRSEGCGIIPELTAYHEAGHALMALLLGGKVKQVTIEPDNDDSPGRSFVGTRDA